MVLPQDPSTSAHHAGALRLVASRDRKVRVAVLPRLDGRRGSQLCGKL